MAGRATWVWLISLAFVSGVATIVAAATVHDRCISSDPACLYHAYTLVHTAGAAVLGFVGAPALISLAVAALLRLKVERRDIRAAKAAWLLAMLSCVIGFIGLVTEGFLMLLTAALTAAATIAAPLPADPSDRLATSQGALARLPER